MNGKLAIVTGANSGIGKEMAFDFARRGAEIVMVCRDIEKAEAVRDQIERTTGNRALRVVHCDLGSLASVREAASELLAMERRFDVLMNNAGIYLPRRYESPEGFEMMFAINHLGPFLLTELLLPRLEGARIITTSSMGHQFCRFSLDHLNAERGFFAIEQYGLTKLANILFARELARREGKRRGIVSHSFHPGPVASGFAQDEPGLFGFGLKLGRLALRSPKRGARTGVFLATSDEASKANGEYWIDEKIARTRPAARDAKLAAGLYEKSLKLTGLA